MSGGFILGHYYYIYRPNHLEYLRRCCQSSVHPLRQFIRYIVRGLYCGVGETVDPVLHSSHHVGGYRQSRRGTPGQAHGIFGLGAAPGRRVIVCSIEVCSPSLWDRTCRLPLGSEHFCRGSGFGLLNRPGHMWSKSKDGADSKSCIFLSSI